MPKLQRSVRVDADLVRRAQKALGARSKTELVERSLAAIVEFEKRRRRIRRFSGSRSLCDVRDT